MAGDRYCESGYRSHTSYGHRHSYRREVYRCGPCDHDYRSRRHFHRHLHRHHRIPFWVFPHVIIRSSFGWMYHG